jgi:hypothetical protein
MNNSNSGKIEAILFDLSGTLVSDLLAVYNGYTRAPPTTRYVNGNLRLNYSLASSNSVILNNFTLKSIQS